MDILTIEEELAENLAMELGLEIEKLNVINLRSSFGDTQTDIVLVPVQAEIEAKRKNRIRVRVIYSSVRERKEWVRCYRCLGHGHIARQYKQTMKK